MIGNSGIFSFCDRFSSIYILFFLRYKVHYIGYSNKYDEWRDGDTLVKLKQDNKEGMIYLAGYCMVLCCSVGQYFISCT